MSHVTAFLAEAKEIHGQQSTRPADSVVRALARRRALPRVKLWSSLFF
jgi:hypothetical protein